MYQIKYIQKKNPTSLKNYHRTKNYHSTKICHGTKNVYVTGYIIYTISSDRIVSTSPAHNVIYQHKGLKIKVDSIIKYALT